MDVVLWLTFCSKYEAGYMRRKELVKTMMGIVNCGGGALSIVGYNTFSAGPNSGRGKMMWKE